MGLKVLLKISDDKPLVVAYDFTDRRVTRVSMSDGTGEKGGMKVDANVQEVLLSFEYTAQDGRPTIQDAEAMQWPMNRTGEEADAAQRELAALPTAVNFGGTPIMDSHQRALELVSEDQGDGGHPGGSDQEPDDSASQVGAVVPPDPSISQDPPNFTGEPQE